jgi:hypothetical protein
LHRTRTYHALAHDFRLAFEDRPVCAYFEQLFDAFAEADGRSVTNYTVVRTENGGFEVRGDAPDVLAGATASGVATAFVHHVNRQAIDGEYAVMSHAGGVERNGVGFVFPAHMESGKTTLTAGLVRAGFGYLTDEAVAFDWHSGVIEPFPKPLSIDEGSQFLFPELRPGPAPGEVATLEGQWQVPASAIRPDALGQPCRARFVVFPRYEAGAATALTPVTRAEALVELAKNTFEFKERPRRALDVLAEIVRGAECYRIAVGSHAEACDLIGTLADG